MQPCRVHQVLWKDDAPREGSWCGACESWICDECRPKVGTRFVAALKDHGTRIREWLESADGDE